VAESMMEKMREFIAFVKAIAPEYTNHHYIIQHYNALKTVLDEAVKIVNFTKSRPMNSRIYSTLCDEMGSSYTTLVLHTGV
jgi:hypothetical protein